jgi:hypothetical protein
MRALDEIRTATRNLPQASSSAFNIRSVATLQKSAAPATLLDCIRRIDG